MIIAHVIAHVDFFKNNIYFSKTNRRMVDEAVTHAERIREYEFKYGRKTVEDFLDAVLSIQEHIQPDLFIREERTEEAEKPKPSPPKPGKYDDLFALDTPRRETPSKTEEEEAPRRFPPKPEKDVVRFIMTHSPVLEPWQRDIMAMIHEEMEYFVPQLQTKIMNEGWASYWHTRILRELDLTDEEFVEFATLHANVVSPRKGSLNPYYVGFKIFEDIERRWDNPTPEEIEILVQYLSGLKSRSGPAAGP